MDWANILEQIFELIVFPILGLVGIFLTQLISAKIEEAKQKTADATAHKYLNILDHTIECAVMATTQTYVKALKEQNAFDVEAQKVAFKQTYDAVIKVLTDEARKHIATIVGDIETYITNKIEAQVGLQKQN